MHLTRLARMARQAEWFLHYFVLSLTHHTPGPPTNSRGVVAARSQRSAEMAQKSSGPTRLSGTGPFFRRAV